MIAISGTIGSGKSEVSRYLRRKGYDVFDCDEENRRLLEEGNEGFLKVAQHFPEVIDDGRLDKKALSKIVFADEEKKKLLESLLHPLILSKLRERKDDPLFAEVPLLFEAGWDRYFDHNVLIVADEDVVVERLLERGMDLQDIRSRMKAQMSAEEKIKRADKIIYNNGSLEELYGQVDGYLREMGC